MHEHNYNKFNEALALYCTATVIRYCGGKRVISENYMDMLSICVFSHHSVTLNVSADAVHSVQSYRKQASSNLMMAPLEH